MSVRSSNLTLRSGVGLCALALAACQGAVGGPEPSDHAGAGNEPTAGASSAGASPSAAAAGTSTGAGAGGQGTGGAGGGAGGGVAVTCTQPTPGAAPVRRLTRFEFNNTVRDLLFDNSNPGNNLPPEVKGNGFSNDAASITTTRVLVDGYHDVAVTLAKRATADAAVLAKISSCDLAMRGEPACAQQFVTEFGRKAFRRPLTDAESTAFTSVYLAGKEGSTHADGLSAVIQMALQSPQFLYRIESGTLAAGSGLRRPTGTEMATRLSYLLWGSTPDARLLELAAAGQLETRAQVRSSSRADAARRSSPTGRALLHRHAVRHRRVGRAGARQRAVPDLQRAA